MVLRDTPPWNLADLQGGVGRRERRSLGRCVFQFFAQFHQSGDIERGIFDGIDALMGEGAVGGKAFETGGIFITALVALNHLHGGGFADDANRWSDVFAGQVSHQLLAAETAGFLVISEGDMQRAA